MTASVAELRPAHGRLPPTDLDAEAAVLSAVLTDPGAFDDVQPILRVRDFYSDANRRIFEAVESLDRDGSEIDVVTVASLLKRKGDLEQVGGTPYLFQIRDATPAVGNVAEHARIVAGRAHQRRLISTFQKLAGEGYGDIEDPFAWGQNAEQRVYEVAREKAVADEDNTLSTLIPAIYDQIQARARGESEAPGIATGYPMLDRRIGGWRRGEAYVIAGRPGMGKSAFAGNAMVNVASLGWGGIFISLEMQREQLGTRMLAAAADVSYRRIETGELNEDEWDSAATQAERLRQLPISIVHAPGATLGSIRSIIRRESNKLARMFPRLRGIGMAAVDYLQLVNGEPARGESREAEVGRISKELKWMAGEFDVAMVECCQLNRGVESRPDKRPRMSDLRESGAIENDAYGIMFPFRPKYYELKKDDRDEANDDMTPEDAEIIIGKHRNGPAPSVPFWFIAPSMRFDTPESWSPSRPHPAEQFQIHDNRDEWHP